MSQIDHNVYFQQQGIDIAGSIERGMKMSDMMSKRKRENAAYDKQAKIDDAYKAGIVQNPDGTSSFDSGRTLSQLAKVGGQEYLTAENEFRSQDAAKRKAQFDGQMQKINTMAQVFGAATDQASYERSMAEAAQFGFDTSNMPKAYDQGLVKQYLTKALNAKEQMDVQAKQQEHQFKVQQEDTSNQFKREQLKLDKQKTAAEVSSKLGGGVTEGEKAVDKDYAKDFNDFTGGGETRAADSIKKLKEFRNQLASDNGIIQSGGGPISGSLPDAVRTQNSIAQRDNIISVANQGLKATFGGQLSDGERKAAANEFYNDKLANAENVKIIDRKIAEMENHLVTQREKANYFGKNRTMKGFRSDGTPQGQQTSSRPEATSTVMSHPQSDQAAEWAKQNPNDPRAQKIMKRLGL